MTVHEAALAFPPSTVPGLRAQVMRATMSISANIAEGAAKSSRREFARYLEIAAGSASEVEHHITIAGDLGVVSSASAERIIDRITHVRRMRFGLRRTVLLREEEAQRERTSPKVDPSLLD